MYDFIHIRYENPSSRLKNKELEESINRRYDTEENLRIINVDHTEDHVCFVVDKVHANREMMDSIFTVSKKLCQ